MRPVALLLVALGLLAGTPAAALSPRAGEVGDAFRARIAFSGEDRQMTDWWFRRNEGAIRRSYDPAGKVPPRIDRELAPNDRLPVAVQKAYLPWGLERLLSPLPAGLDRFVVGHHIVLVDRRTATVLDVMRDVVR
jgi:hypothetical protein